MMVSFACVMLNMFSVAEVFAVKPQLWCELLQQTEIYM